MYKLIGADGKEYGPVPAEVVREWIRERRANAQTRARPEGTPDWTTLGALPEFASDLSSRPAPPPLPGFPNRRNGSSASLNHCCANKPQLMAALSAPYPPGTVSSARWFLCRQ